MFDVHERMPEILEKVDWAVLLGEKEGDLASLLWPNQGGLLEI